MTGFVLWTSYNARALRLASNGGVFTQNQILWDRRTEYQYYPVLHRDHYLK